MSILFDGAFTPQKSVNSSMLVTGEGPAWAKQAETESYATRVIDEFRALQSTASSLAESAANYIDDCVNFTVTPSQINYTPPAFVAPSFTDFTSDANLTLDLTCTLSDTVDPSPIVTVADEFALQPHSDVAVPDNAIQKPTEVNIVSQATAPAYTAESYDFTVGTPPAFPSENANGTVPEPEAPGTTVEGLEVEGEFEEADDYAIPEGLTDGIAEIETAKAALNTLIQGLPTIPTYSPKFNDIFACVGALLTDFPFTAQQQDITALRDEEYRTGFALRVQELWPEAPLPATALSAQGAWLANEDLRFAAQAANRRSAFGSRAANDAKVLAFSLGAEAHKIGMDIVLGVIKAELTYISVLMDAMQSWYGAASSAYAGSIALFEAQAEIQTVSYTQEEFRVQQYEVDATTQTAKGKLNAVKADLFSIQERVKAVPLQGLKAELQREKAKVEAFDASKEGDAGSTAALEAGLYTFKAECLEWSANAQKLVAEYKAAIGNITTARQQNQALIEAEGAKTGKYAADSAVIAAEVARIEAGFSEIQRGYATLGLDLAETSATNTVQGYLAEEYGFAEALKLQELKTELSIDAGKLEGRASFNNDVLTYLKTVSDAAYRAASQAQQANNQLVTAYANAQKAAGDASAAIEAGKWSGWNVTATAKAIGNISGTILSGSSETTSLANHVTESDESTQTVNTK